MLNNSFDVIVQGPLYLSAVRSMVDSSIAAGANKIIYSVCCDADLLGAREIPGLTVVEHEDPGPNNVSCTSRPLNINRYIAGVISSLKEVSANNVIIVRSDIIFDVGAFLRLVSYDDSILNCLDVTSKRWWAKPRWRDHFCDWAYFMKVSIANDLFASVDYDNSDTDWSSHGGAFKISPESLIAGKFFEISGSTQDNRLKTTNIVFHDDINLKCVKKAYSRIPFGINRAFGIRKFDLLMLRHFGYYIYGPISTIFSSVIHRLYFDRK